MLVGSGALVAGVGAAGLTGCVPESTERTTIVQNPLVRQRADPHVMRTSTGEHLFTGSVPEYDRIVLRRSPTLRGLGTAAERTLWTRPGSGAMGGHVWAPEIHAIAGRWFVYFAAGDAGDPFRMRPYVLEADGPDPMTADWSVRGRIETELDTFALDATTFALDGERYLLWAQSEPGIDTNSNLRIARMSGPATLIGPEARIAVPTMAWETRGFSVNEGPSVLVRNGRVFVSFSASATDANYCIGLLTADRGADLLDPASWRKSPEPVMVSDESTGQFGPGHSCFTTATTARGAEIDVLVYHARPYRRIEGDPLFDPNRHARAQRLGWNTDGTPAFGAPVADGPLRLDT